MTKLSSASPCDRNEAVDWAGQSPYGVDDEMTHRRVRRGAGTAARVRRSSPHVFEMTGRERGH